jgi:hypothetical protein
MNDCSKFNAANADVFGPSDLSMTQNVAATLSVTESSFRIACGQRVSSVAAAYSVSIASKSDGSSDKAPPFHSACNPARTRTGISARILLSEATSFGGEAESYSAGRVRRVTAKFFADSFS